MVYLGIGINITLAHTHQFAVYFVSTQASNIKNSKLRVPDLDYQTTIPVLCARELAL